jgi:D-alanyl-D-alanine-carboxypeptidase/D-alanyl-D-alanine-endopeptidase
MTWTQHAAHALADTVAATQDNPEVVIATAAVDESGTTLSPEALGRFEIGSVTKTMTATVLAGLVHEGLLDLDDTVDRWLSAGPNGHITVRELATHTSGLPAIGPNFRDGRTIDTSNPWHGYGFAQAEAGLTEATPKPDHPWAYSNFGYQLLGLILERVSGLDYPSLINERLLTPLGMTHSGVGQRGEGTALTGHAGGREVRQWDQPWGAGGVEATIEDLARYARACLFPPATSVGEAIRIAGTPVLRVSDDAEQALGWVVRGEVREHSGGTGGFSACVTTDRGRGRAVAVLVSNQVNVGYSDFLKRTARQVLADADQL